MRNEIAELYRELLGDEDRIELPPAAPEGCRHGYHLFPWSCARGAEARLAGLRRLREAGIGVQVHYIRFTGSPITARRSAIPRTSCPAAEEYYAGAVSLPMFPEHDREGVERVVAELREGLG